MNDNLFTRLKFGNIFLAGCILSIILIFIPICFYIFTFYKFPISKNQSDWADFGSFLSGTVGIILSFLGAIFALLSIVITSKIALTISETEQKMNELALQNETQNAESSNKIQLQIAKYQREMQLQSVRPFGIINCFNYANKIIISVKNAGLGPLSVLKFRVFDENEVEFESINELVKSKMIQNHNFKYTFFSSIDNLVMSPNESLSLFLIQTEKVDEHFKEYTDMIRDILKVVRVQLNYCDLYKTPYSASRNFSIFELKHSIKSPTDDIKNV